MEIQAATSVIHLEHVAGQTRFVAAGVSSQIPVEDVEMNASDTPRTDAKCFVSRQANNGMFGHPAEFAVPADFARTLERELSEAKFSAEHKKHLLEGAVFHRKKAELDRDQWKESATELASLIDTCNGHGTPITDKNVCN